MLTKQQLKEKLLATTYFIDNTYLNEYVDLIFNYDCTSKGYREHHHVLQVAYYKQVNSCKNRKEALKYVNNDLDNWTVYLLYKDHCKAHYLLYFCTTDFLKSANCNSIHFILKKYQKLNKNNSVNKFDIDFEILQKYYNCIVEDEQSRYYTEEEIAFLQANYPIYGEAYCAEILGRSKNSIRSKATKLNLTMDKWWTDDEIKFLLNNYKLLGPVKCSATLNKTYGAIISKASKLGLTETHFYSESDLLFIQTNYPIYGAKYCAEHLGRTTDAIKRFARVNGIKGKVQGTKIYCPELNMYFDSIKKASEQLHLSDGNICAVVNKKAKTTKGLHFIKVNENEK